MMMPNAGLPRSRPLPDRFWEKVDRRRPGECWPWLGAKDPKGYGKTSDGKRQLRASRTAWELHHGRPFPADKYALHNCDNPGCVNPDHIRPGTHRENMRDMTARGRRLKTHCPNGHQYTPDTTRIRGRGKWRCCVICKRNGDATYKQRRRASRLSLLIGEGGNG